MMKHCAKISAICFLLLINGCASTTTQKDISAAVDSVSRYWVPDKREGICNINCYVSNGKALLKGETNVAEAKQAITRIAASAYGSFIDSVKLLPDTTEIKNYRALVNVSVCNIRAKPDHDQELISQAVMGTPLLVLEEKDGWAHIQTPDFYLGWVDEDAITTLSSSEFSQWKMSKRVIFTGKTGELLSETDGETVTDIVAGTILRTDGRTGKKIRLILPDGREGVLPEENLHDFREWATSKRPLPENLVKTARSMMGTPYLWGGTSVRGLDCSGFVKTVYFLNGIILARDASLQVRHGIVIADHRNISDLKKGDLLFFGWNRDKGLKPTHVGMYIGDTEFIQEAGMVRINSLDSTRKNFSRYRSDSFLAARRIIEAPTGRGIQPVINHPWYF